METGQVRIPPGMIDDADGSQYTPEEIEFMNALDHYKMDHHRPFPTCGEVLAVAKALGYRKAAERKPLPVFSRDSRRHWITEIHVDKPTGVPLTVVQVFHWWAIFRLVRDETSPSSTTQSRMYAEPELVGWALTEGEADEIARSMTQNIDVAHTDDDKLRGRSSKSLFPSRPTPRKT